MRVGCLGIFTWSREREGAYFVGYVLLPIRYYEENRACEEKFLGGPARGRCERAICLECPRPSAGVRGAKINYFSELLTHCEI